MVAMGNETGAKRALRLLDSLAGGHAARMRPAGSSACVLELHDGRRRRCPIALIEQMAAHGWIVRQSDAGGDGVRIIATEDGLSWRGRMAAGGGFADQHRDMGTLRLGDRERATANLAESPLARLARSRGRGQRPWLDEAQLAAGERLRADFEFGQLRPKVTASWNPARTVRDGAGAGGAADLSDRAIDARARFNGALEAVGPELAGLLVDVCCFLKGLEEIECARGWPRRSAKVVLRTALSALDRHYNPPRNRSAPMRHWGSDGYRPTLSP
jgi:hypothetical protein